VYRIVLFDQRGAGKSEPYVQAVKDTGYMLIFKYSRLEGEHHLGPWYVNVGPIERYADMPVSDIEILREKLGIDKWVVFGGSW
jgi:proline iminopeptidase